MAKKKKFDWKDHFAKCKDPEDFIRLFKRIGSDRRSRREYMNYLKRQENRQFYESVNTFKEKRHDRRLRIKAVQQHLDEKKKQKQLITKKNPWEDNE